MGGTTQRAWNSRTAGGATLLLALMLVSAVRAASVEKGFSRSSFTEHRIDTLYRRDYAAPVSMPNWLALVPGSGVGLLPSYMAAPAGLEFVVRASDPSARTFSTATSGAIADVAFSRWHAVLGYCEAGSTPCTLANTDRVLGCCPAGQVCGYNRGTGTFIGCLDSIGQECYGRRCNPGYVCCPARDGGKSQCVPDLGSVDASCGTATVYEERRASGKKGEVLAAAVGKSRGYKSYDRVKPAGYNGTITTYEGVNVTADAALGVFRCPHSRAWCRTGDECVAFNTTRTVVDRSNVTIPAVVSTVTFYAACCPTNWTACYSPNVAGETPASGSRGSSTRVVGCADTDAGEVCCGAAICPANNQCCTAPADSTGAASARSICCSASDQCCWSETRGIYCGKTVDGQACAADSRAPPLWYLQEGALDGAVVS